MLGGGGEGGCQAHGAAKAQYSTGWIDDVSI